MENYEEMLKEQQGTIKDDVISFFRYLKTGGMAVALAGGIGLGSQIYSVWHSIRQPPAEQEYYNQITRRAVNTFAYNAVAAVGLGVMAYADSRLRQEKKKMAEHDDLDKRVIEELVERGEQIEE